MSRQRGPQRYKLVVEYDGTNFSGWQKQTDARTVQGDLQKSAARILGSTVVRDIQGCGRTDSGVHALGYVAHLETAKPLDLANLLERLNDALPKDLAVVSIAETDPRFHARHSCVARSYIYQLKRRKSAFAKRYNWWIREQLDVPAMRQAAELMVGMHDFAAFAEKQELKKSTRVLVHAVQLLAGEDTLTIRVVGSHFLWHMVRRMVGVLVEVGCHRMTDDDVRRLLAAHAPLIGHLTAPPAGLFFERAFYDLAELSGFLSESGATGK